MRNVCKHSSSEHSAKVSLPFNIATRCTVHRNVFLSQGFFDNVISLEVSNQNTLNRLRFVY